MRLVITGARGFVGKALVECLAANHDILAVDTAPSLVDIGLRVTQIEGDIMDAGVLSSAFGRPCDALVHLATVPGGAAERDPATAMRVNVDATLALVDAAADAGDRPRIVFASSIAVFGDPLPDRVDDDTPLQPRMLYGAHKAMMEQWIATQSRRGAIDGVSLRLPGVVARPRGPSGMKSAFMSDIFHALSAHAPFVSPVSPHASMWMMSVRRTALNLAHAVTAGGTEWPASRALTLPALRIRMKDLAHAILQRTGASPDLLSYAPDAALEAAFGAQPPLVTSSADRLGFLHDGNCEALVAAALETLT